jgi:membrane associated rhomboid family serine protease
VSQPTRPPAIQPTGIFEGLRPRPILIGVVVDNVATVVTSLLVLSLFAAQIASQHGGEIPDEAMDTLARSTEFLLASLVTGLACTVFGAYVGATQAASSHVRHGAWIGVASAITGLFFYAIQGQEVPRPPLWFDVVGFTLIIPAGAVGGLLARFRSTRRAVDEPPGRTGP